MAMTNYNKIYFLNITFTKQEKTWTCMRLYVKMYPNWILFMTWKPLGEKKNEKNYDIWLCIILIFNRLQIMNEKLLRYIYTIYLLIPS
jgi:hypothetical protein